MHSAANRGVVHWNRMSLHHELTSEDRFIGDVAAVGHSSHLGLTAPSETRGVFGYIFNHRDLYYRG